ncbi:nucleoside deaminase [Saccharopolyspora sp. HNM0983]|uniref:Nucleoside deaminase n=1 Tax=Saccharopolyspora montiporae TaxID=2781240 RepID=A0A929BDM0_9PSEU|nr:nucleoside deaminase [Saccharopolyspora sp. HNM0983]MBE9376121.1 nucleoside deaminase [Saccharopolyspora sp. HNM0983]
MNNTRSAVQQEQEFMRLAVRLAEKSVAEGGGPFAALVVRGDEVVATGINRVTLDTDPTAHAEVSAIRAACRELGEFELAGAVLVSSCEPCPMCRAAAMWARLDRVLYGADRHDAAAAGFDDRAFHEAFRDPDAPAPAPQHQVVTPDRTAPFAAWSAKPDRIDY